MPTPGAPTLPSQVQPRSVMRRLPRLRSSPPRACGLALSPLPSVVRREAVTLHRPRSSQVVSPLSPTPLVRLVPPSLLSRDEQAVGHRPPPPPPSPTRPPLISLLVVDYAVAAPTRGSAASAGICGERAMRRSLSPSTFPPDLQWWLPQWAAGDP
jgi:hypothetical protein